jgi:Fe-S-cluster-containing hydrogenase component 2
MIEVREERCTGCRLCEVACSMWHHNESNPGRSRVRVLTTWPSHDEVALCRQCEARPCVKACDFDVLAIDGDGVVVLEQSGCTMCMACVEACPFNRVPVDAVSGYPLFCDTCRGEYECVRWCPTKVFEVVEL